MKKIEAIVRPEKLDAVIKALEEASYSGIMITEIQGHGKQKGMVQQWRGQKYKIEFLTKVKIEVVARDADVPEILKAISGAAKTGEIGDGKIFVSPIEYCERIRTGETGETAL
jgi:nitrogen regulatory protein P-II 1